LASFRLDPDSIRVRVSLEEARTLLKQESLNVTWSLPGQTVELKVMLYPRDEELTLVTTQGFKNLELRVPAQPFKTLIAELQSEPKRKVDPSLSAAFQQGGTSNSLKFEIDIFSLKRKSSNS
jgi:hypothetical protein